MKRRYKLKRRGRMFHTQHGGVVQAIAAKAAMVGVKVAKIASKIARISQKVPHVIRASTHVVARAIKHFESLVKPMQKAIQPIARAYGRAKAATYYKVIRSPFEKAMAQASLGRWVNEVFLG